MKIANEILKEVYQINLDAAEQGKAIAEKNNDQHLLQRFEEDASIWRAKLENFKD